MGFLENLRANREAQRLALIERMYKIYAKGVNGYDGNMSDAEILELQMFLRDPKNKLDFDNYARRRLNGVPYDGEEIVITGLTPVPNNQIVETDEPLAYGDSDEAYWQGNITGISPLLMLELEGRAAEIAAEREAKAKRKTATARTRTLNVTSSKNGSKMEVLYAAKGAKTQLLNLLLQKFVVDLGFLSGAKSDLEAILTGAYVFEQLRLNLPLQLLTLMLIWTEAEKLQEGAGKQALLLTLQSSNTQTGSSQTFYPVNGAPASYGQAYMAKLGAKLVHISELNGKCPEGFEVEKYMAGGCVKCRRGKKLLEMFNKKKRFGKGNTIELTKHNSSAGSRETYSDTNSAASVNILGRDSTFTSYRKAPGNTNKLTHVETNSKTARKNYYDFKKSYEDLLKAKKHEDGGLMDFLKCGGKSRIKKHSGGGIPDVEESNTVNNSKTKRKRFQDGNNWAYRDITARNDTSYLSEVNGIREYELDARKHFEELLRKKKLEQSNKPVQSNKCGNVIKKHDIGGILEWMKKLLGQSTTLPATLQNTRTTNSTAPILETTDTKFGVQRQTSNVTGDGYVDGSFYEGYRGLNGSWADIDWPEGLGRGKRRIVQESNPGVADSLSYRYFNRPVPKTR